MAEAPSSMFNKNAVDKLRNPDDLERCVQVTNPSLWAVLAACIMLLAGLLAWSVFGSVTTSVTSTGAVLNNEAICFLSAEDAAKVHVGDAANFGGARLEVSKIATLPLSIDEAQNELQSDFLATTLLRGDWGYQIAFSGDYSALAENVPQTVSITVERIAPITLILKRQA